MTSFILFPTTTYIRKAALVCEQEGFSLDHISITSRHNVLEKINAAINQHDLQHIVVFAPFTYNEKIQAGLENISYKNIEINWYGESNQIAFNQLKNHENIITHLIDKVPKPSTDIENYIQYKKTLSFLGDKNGKLAAEHLKEAIEHLAHSTKIPEEDEPSIKAFKETDFPAIEGLSPKMIFLKKEVHRVAAAGLDKILLLGETGTGKEAAAFFLHTLDPLRRKGKFGSINCAVLQEDLLISELFGHEKGAFTGATKQKHGLVSELNGGTIFLDELPDLPQRVQAMLLRFLESGTYTPLGSTQSKQADIKIVSAAQKSLLKEKLRTKQFRQDLYYRIAGKTISLPSLKEIPEDIPSLIVHLAYKVEHDSEKRDQAISYFFSRIDQLKRHTWPGNVRELANYITRKVKLGPDEHINLNENLMFTGSIDQRETFEPSHKNSASFDPIQVDNLINIDSHSIDSLEKIKREYSKRVYEALTGQGVSQSAISKQLGISVNTLKKLIST